MGSPLQRGLTPSWRELKTEKRSHQFFRFRLLIRRNGGCKSIMNNLFSNSWYSCPVQSLSLSQHRLHEKNTHEKMKQKVKWWIARVECVWCYCVVVDVVFLLRHVGFRTSSSKKPLNFRFSHSVPQDAPFGSLESVRLCVIKNCPRREYSALHKQNALRCVRIANTCVRFASKLRDTHHVTII